MIFVLVSALSLLLMCLEDMAEASSSSSDGKIEVVSWHIKEFKDYFVVLILILCIILFKMFYPRIPYIPSYLPQSLVLIILGLFFALILGKTEDGKKELVMLRLTPNLFFHVLLPPIVLDASYNLYNRTFTDHFISILIYAVFGTILNFFIIGPLMYGIHMAGGMGNNIPNVSFNAYLLFASLIVAVDPVAVLAIFQDIGVNLGLYYMVFGESLLNDAVTVVLYRIMSNFVGITTITSTQVGLAFVSFLTISLGGLLVGVVFGVLTALLTRWHSPFEGVLTLLLAYFAYMLGDCLGWSGIIAMIGCGLVQADYAFSNLEEASVKSVEEILKQVAEICESIIFFMIGIELIKSQLKWHSGFCLWGLICCLIARAVAVLLLTGFINLFKVNDQRISLTEQAILVYGGLRGAVAFALSVLVEESGLGNKGQNIRLIIMTTTMFIILATVGLMGLTMKPLVKLLHIGLAKATTLSIFTNLIESTLDHSLAGVEAIIGFKGRNRVREFFTRIDDLYLRRWLQREPVSHDEKFIKTYEQIALKLHYATFKPSQSSNFLENLPENIVKMYLTSAQSGSDLTHFSEPKSEDSSRPITTSHTPSITALRTLSLFGARRASLLRNGKQQDSFPTLYKKALLARGVAVSRRLKTPTIVSVNISRIIGQDKCTTIKMKTDATSKGNDSMIHSLNSALNKDPHSDHHSGLIMKPIYKRSAD